MKFDNENTVLRLHVLKIIFAIIIVSIIILFYTTTFDDFIERTTGVTKRPLLLIMVAGYMLFYIYHLIVKTSYLFFSDDGSKIIIRFYPVRPLNPVKRSIEIPKNQFYKYTINRTSLVEEVVVYQKVGNKISKYPPFSLKGLSKQQKDALFHSLNQYSQAVHDQSPNL